MSSQLSSLLEQLPAHAGDWTPVLIMSENQASATDLPAAPPWINPLVKRGYLGSPLVEVTPFVFRDRLFRLENEQKLWSVPGAQPGEHFLEDEVRIRDVESDVVVSTPLTGHAFGVAFVWEDRVYVFAGNYGQGKAWRQITEIVMTSSTDLQTWTAPQIVLRAEPGEHLFNVAVCRGTDKFVLLYETDDPAFQPFTFKYCTSTDLVNWKLVEGAIYGREKYTGGPALYYEGEYFYTLYLHDLGGRWETRVSRSRDLIHWQDAPDDRPFLTFDSNKQDIPLRPAGTREINASDAELVHWKGKTLIYFTGSDQQIAGDLQWAEFDGSPRELLESFYAEPQVATPSVNQLGYQQDPLGTFIHFGPASYTGVSDMLSTPGAEIFNPVHLDADQWMRAAVAMGASRVVLTAKHHNGFCLWPTATTEYSVKNSPWKDGQGDVVREYVDAARRAGLKVGLYFSLGDKHWGCWSTPEPMGQRHIVGDRTQFLAFAKAQLTELLTSYGQLDLLWFDGAYDPFGWDVMDAQDNVLGTQDGDEIAALVRSLQPGACIFGGTRPDGRWSGTEEGFATDPSWNVIKLGEGPTNFLAPSAAGWHYVEALLYTSATWFWTPTNDGTLRSFDYLKTAYYSSVGRGANMLMNLTPDTSGLISAAEFARLQEFGDAIRSESGRPRAAVQDCSQWTEDHTLELPLPEACVISRVSIEEDLRFGQRVRAHRIEAWQDGHWRSVIESTSIGRLRIHTFAPVEAAQMRLRVLRCDGLPKIKSFTAS